MYAPSLWYLPRRTFVTYFGKCKCDPKTRLYVVKQHTFLIRQPDRIKKKMITLISKTLLWSRAMAVGWFRLQKSAVNLQLQLPLCWWKGHTGDTQAKMAGTSWNGYRRWLLPRIEREIGENTNEMWRIKQGFQGFSSTCRATDKFWGVLFYFWNLPWLSIF